MGVDLNYSFPLRLAPHFLAENLALAFGNSCLLSASKYKDRVSAYCRLDGVEYKPLTFGPGAISYGTEVNFCDIEGTRRSLFIHQRQGENDESSCSPRASTLWIGAFLRANLFFGGSMLLRDSDEKTRLTPLKEVLVQDVGLKSERENVHSYLLSRLTVLTPAELLLANCVASYSMGSMSFMTSLSEEKSSNKVDPHNIGYFELQDGFSKNKKKDIMAHFKEQKLEKSHLNEEIAFLKNFEDILKKDFDEIFKDQNKVKVLRNIFLFKLLNESFECLFESEQNKEFLEKQAQENKINIDEKMWLLLPQKESKKNDSWASLSSRGETHKRYDYSAKINLLLSQCVGDNELDGTILLWGIQEFVNSIKKLPIEEQSGILSECIKQAVQMQTVFYSAGTNETKSYVSRTIADHPKGFVTDLSASLEKELNSFVIENVEQEVDSNLYLYADFLRNSCTIIIRELTDNFNDLETEDFLNEKRQLFLNKGLCFSDLDCPPIIDFSSLLTVKVRKEIASKSLSEERRGTKKVNAALSSLAQKKAKTLMNNATKKGMDLVQTSFSLLDEHGNEIKELIGLNLEVLNDFLNHAYIQEEFLEDLKSSTMDDSKVKKTINFCENLFKALSNYACPDIEPKIKKIIKQTVDVISLSGKEIGNANVLDTQNPAKEEIKISPDCKWSETYFNKLKTAHADAIIELSNKKLIYKKQIENCIADPRLKPYEELPVGVYQSYSFGHLNPAFFSSLDRTVLAVCSAYLAKTMPILENRLDLTNINDGPQKYEKIMTPKEAVSASVLKSQVPDKEQLSPAALNVPAIHGQDFSSSDSPIALGKSNEAIDKVSKKTSKKTKLN